MLWNTVKETLEIAGYPVEDLSKEFGVKSPKSNKNTGTSQKDPTSDQDGHGNA